MSNDKMREEFEAWSAEHYYLGGCSIDLEDGEYKDPDMEYAWASWQASRAEIKINLPRPTSHGDNEDSYFNTQAWDVEDVEEACEAAGIKIESN